MAAIRRIIPIFIFILVALLMFFSMSQAHEVIHQEIYTRGCIYANTSVHISSPAHFLETSEVMYTDIEKTKGCRTEVWELNMVNEIIGYQLIVPLAMIIGLLAAIFVKD